MGSAGLANTYAVVEFRIIVFRPFKGEVLLARIRSSTPAGIHRTSAAAYGSDIQQCILTLPQYEPTSSTTSSSP